MTFEESMNYLHSLTRFGIKPGTDRMLSLLDALGNPQDSLKYIHVAGTNGKGSTCYMCASVLKEAGYKTGLFVSPYVVCFNERIQIDFNNIPDSDFALLATQVREAREKADVVITEFEFITAVAFLYFAREKCDYVVLEVGLGGKLDATNVIKAPEVSVIASISLDHTGILGNTLYEIAGEKCGIIKQNRPTVMYPLQDKDVRARVEETCKEKNSPLCIPCTDSAALVSDKVGEIVYSYKSMRVVSHLWGKYQMYNGITVIETMRTVGIPDEIILRGIEKARIPGRLEIVRKNPDIMLDVGHNPDGVRATVQAVRTYLEDKNGGLIAVLGMCEDKDYAYCVDQISPLAKTVIAVPGDTPRALAPEKICEIAGNFAKEAIGAESVAEGIDRAISLAKEDDLILVCGSFYVISPAREYLIRQGKSQ